MKLWLLGSLLFMPVFASAATLHVVVSNVPDETGTIRAAVCKKDEFLTSNCAGKRVVPAKTGEVEITFEGLPPDTYAVQVFQDRNGNNLLDKNFLGVPREPLGFSRAAPMRFGPPRFSDAAFVLGEQESVVPVVLRTR
ncbi:hypothetical protein AA106555_1619 [Neokomagataea thailandica NBRC 106555]|uniref:DUF2141 domain-containing protein n=2 Tax=Neokomagataea TaxID=1223423 RepID=A0A4Y6V583_9PROT|nr:MULTISPECIES: DUF2141 domain-containing protein [Neokomagataea]QDH25262.1 DUF2141 domain-containing protein [Neokomagataea tanensis]GBR54274.1 hypothetical protein AA106555_1619 [Neokomagataea thailandica NBRC 106555]